jgi:hypothetical protein
VVFRFRLKIGDRLFGEHLLGSATGDEIVVERDTRVVVGVQPVFEVVGALQPAGIDRAMEGRSKAGDVVWRPGNHARRGNQGGESGIRFCRDGFAVEEPSGHEAKLIFGAGRQPGNVGGNADRAGAERHRAGGTNGPAGRLWVG